MAASQAKWTKNVGIAEGDLKVVLFHSRNKDNREVEGFHERRQSFLWYDSLENRDRLFERFDDFVRHGVKGENSRLYMSLNARRPEKVKKALIIELLEKDNLCIGRINSIAASVAARKECAWGNAWLIDFDDHNEDHLNEAVEDVKKGIISGSLASDAIANGDISAEELVSVHKTKNNYSIVTNIPFDPQVFIEKWGDVAELKKDGMLYIIDKTKE